MVDSSRYQDWIQKAKKDINAALILKEHDCGNDLVSFHCQQAIEKLLKGYIIYKINKIVEGHSLVYLCKICMNFNPELKKYIKDCAFVNQYYIETRYPSEDTIEVSDEEAQECIKISKEIFQLIENDIK
ncbi:MAG: hypothetical protein PWQ97_703 [Tepidanaerobacteraceae bacterium]|nr:hypothetical protein [Tepidanaerobacteraceae bacterium]HHW01817.1 HEPN domain-containing protein [Thermoanaerobacterales bacterium]